jgi:fatty acid synthase subunit beta
MQHAVEHDSENWSNYTMCAINPGHIPKTCADAALRKVVDSIAGRIGTLLEIVNYDFEVSLPPAVYPTDLRAISV